MVGGRWLNNHDLVGGRWSVVVLVGGRFFHSHWSVVGGFSDRWSVVPLVCGRLFFQVSGRWSMVPGRWSMVPGRWSVVGVTVVGGLWSVAGRWAVVLYYAGWEGHTVRSVSEYYYILVNTCA